MKKKYMILDIAIAIIVIAWIWFFIIRPDNPEELKNNDAKNNSAAINTQTGSEPVKNILWLTTQTWFSIEHHAQWLTWPRVMAFDPAGNLAVSETKAGKVAIILKDSWAWENRIIRILSGLSDPHWLLFREVDGKQKLYVAETDKVSVYDYTDLKATGKKVLVNLPSWWRHTTRTLLWLPDGRILISIWSSCDTCIEKDDRRWSVLVMNSDWTGLRKFATWLRNSVFMTIDPKNWNILATDMWRDFLGDNIPPDEVNIIEDWWFYGWPYCYWKNVTDKVFDRTANAERICSSSIPSFVDLQAHSAPLGLTFITDAWTGWYSWSLLVAYHGSWNRSEPTGYKIVRIKLDTAWNYAWTEDFITWWIASWDVVWRPAGLLFSAEWTLYISDDKSWAIYRVAQKR
ncbi:MAG: L-sorbosone dehydrogenase [uncultured bacterium (gcode 4)]|uniref:L-sorbosone dehydrogenase n=1 Tax=uncultured bacterium (gcode 4) TaxID=1234023 RepID=K2GIM9_9BACT|nr:MAG: L-sorbosone dehydrogenase [uncultured bacterium (gcode 4)]